MVDDGNGEKPDGNGEKPEEKPADNPGRVVGGELHVVVRDGRVSAEIVLDTAGMGQNRLAASLPSKGLREVFGSDAPPLFLTAVAGELAKRPKAAAMILVWLDQLDEALRRPAMGDSGVEVLLEDDGKCDVEHVLLAALLMGRKLRDCDVATIGARLARPARFRVDEVEIAPRTEGAPDGMKEH